MSNKSKHSPGRNGEIYLLIRRWSEFYQGDNIGLSFSGWKIMTFRRFTEMRLVVSLLAPLQLFEFEGTLFEFNCLFETIFGPQNQSFQEGGSNWIYSGSPLLFYFLAIQYSLLNDMYSCKQRIRWNGHVNKWEWAFDHFDVCQPNPKRERVFN